MKPTDRWNKSYQRYSLHTTEYFNGFYTIKRFESLLIFKDKLSNLLNDAENKYYQMDAEKEHSRFVSNLLYSLSTIPSLGLGVYFVSIDQLTAGALMSLYLAEDRVTIPIISSIQFTNQLLSSRPLIDSCKNIISNKEKPINNIVSQKFTDDTVLEIDDEALSGLDKESYRQVFDLMLNFPGTVIDIEHNVQPAFTKKYDKVIGLDQYAL